MRILLISNLYPTPTSAAGGVFVSRRIEAYEALGHSVDAWSIVPRRGVVLRAAIRLLGRRTQRTIMSTGSPFRPLVVGMSTLDYLLAWRFVNVRRRIIEKSARRLLALSNERAYDLVVAHGMYLVPAGDVARSVARRIGSNYVVSLHGSDVNYVMAHRRRRYAEIMNDAAALTFVSQALSDAAVTMGVTNPNTFVIPNGVDLATFSTSARDARAALDIDPAAKVVAFVGAFTPVKGADRLPEIVSALHSARPGTTILLAGDGPLRNAVASRVGDQARTLGHLSAPEVATLLAAADVLILPSRNEGWPTVIFEAFASGTSVVGTSVGGIPEALGSLGWLVNEGDGFAERFASAVGRALDAGPRRAGELREVATANTWAHVAVKEIEIISAAAGRCG